MAGAEDMAGEAGRLSEVPTCDPPAVMIVSGPLLRYGAGRTSKKAALQPRHFTSRASAGSGVPRHGTYSIRSLRAVRFLPRDFAMYKAASAEAMTSSTREVSASYMEIP